MYNIMKKVTIYTTGTCQYCTQAKALLHFYGVEEVSELRVDQDPALLAEMMQKTGRRTVPQIFIGDELIGGFSDLDALHRQDALKGRIFTQSQ